MPIFDSIADENSRAAQKLRDGWVNLYAEKEAEIRALNLVIQERESEISRLMDERARVGTREAALAGALTGIREYAKNREAAGCHDIFLEAKRVLDQCRS